MRDHRPRRPFSDRAVVVDVAHYDGRFVAVGSGVWVSDDGLAWTRAEPQIRRVMTVAAGDLGWLVLTENGQLWVSSDASEWDGPHPTPAALRGNLYAGPTRLAVGAAVEWSVEAVGPYQMAADGRVVYVSGVERATTPQGTSTAISVYHMVREGDVWTIEAHEVLG